MLNMLWSRIFDVTFPSTILTISSRLQTQFNQNEKNRDWKVNWILLKEPTRIICVEITVVGGWKNIAERANAQNLRQFHPSPLHRYMSESQHVGLVKSWQKLKFWEERKDLLFKSRMIVNAINCQVLQHFALHPLFHCCCQCPVSNTKNYFML